MQKNQQAPKGIHRQTIEERLDQIASMTELGQVEIQCLKKFGNLPEETANGMVENVIGVMGIPFGVATNLILDGKEMLVLMATGGIVGNRRSLQCLKTVPHFGRSDQFRFRK